MKEMTTAEFAKANLAALEEPVSVRRYTKVVGTYFPAGYEPEMAPAPPTLGLEDTIAPSSVKATQKIVEELTEEVAKLKKELAKRPLPAVAPIPVTVDPYRPARAVGDPFAGLAKQDKDFFERKLGTTSKKKS